MANVGMFNASLNPTDFNAKSFAAMITRLFPNGSSPLFGLTAYLQAATALQFEHGHFAKTWVFPSVTLNGAISSAGTTTFVVVSTENILPGMQLRAQSTGEIVVVNSVTDSTHIVVTRGVGTVAAGNIADTVVLYNVGNAFEEGSDRPSNRFVLPARLTNYTQIFRNSWQLTGTAGATKVIAGDGNIAENRQDCAMIHAVDIETALFFGQQFLGTRNGQPFHTMDGLINTILTYASGNVNTASGTTNYTQLETLLDPVFDVATDPKTANERIMFCGGKARVVLNNIGRLNGTYQIMDGQTSYGLQFGSFKISRGTFRIIEHPLFNSNTAWAKMAVVVDLPTFRLAYLGDRKTMSQEYGTSGVPVDNGIDAIGGTLTSELTTEIRNPQANAVIYGLTAAAVG